ncbi:MAG TPA: hypothetical protein VEB66_02625 [Opitutaceae bacterium]|nr:hypothetical protein [Opitutaceae bacterium]
MNPDHLIAVLFAAAIMSAFIVDYRAAGRDTPVRIRLDRRPRRPHDRR